MRNVGNASHNAWLWAVQGMGWVWVQELCGPRIWAKENLAGKGENVGHESHRAGTCWWKGWWWMRNSRAESGRWNPSLLQVGFGGEAGVPAALFPLVKEIVLPESGC